MRTENLSQKKAEKSENKGSFEPASARAFARTIQGLAPGNVFAILGIIAAFTLFAVYEYARTTQLEAEKHALRSEVLALRNAPEITQFSVRDRLFSVASETPSPVDYNARASAPLPAAPQNDSFVPLVSHFSVLSGIMLIVLLLAWKQRLPAKLPVPPQLTETHEPEGVFDALSLAVAHWAPDGRLVGCNARFRHLFGDEAETICANVAHGAVMKALTGDADIHLVQDDEHRRIVEISSSGGPAFLMEERPLKSGGFVSLISDNSATKSAERALDDLREEQRLMALQLREEKFRAESASRAKTSFLAHLSHDVRTPLNHIIGFADMIAHQTYGPVGDKRYLNYISDIKGSGEKLLSSFTDILELAQIEGGQLVLRRERLRVDDVLTTTANRFQDSAKRAGLVFEISIPESGLLYGDRFCIERMVGNLVENAIQFTPSGGSVRLAAYLAEDGVVIEISDTGIGMSQERLKDLEQPFVLGDAAFTRETSGVGLGISISRAIAELSGGMMDIDSNPAIGTTVAISLPLQPAQTGQQVA